MDDIYKRMEKRRAELERLKQEKKKKKIAALFATVRKEAKNNINGSYSTIRLISLGVDLDWNTYDSGENPGNKQ